jgi:DNA-binding response OmpR family regulator
MTEVLLVEDELDLATTIIDYLEIEDIRCDHASNGQVALNLIQNNHYQMIILDINMPQMDGLTLCKTLRQDGNDTPILMLTARDSLEQKLEGFNAGTDDYLVKPFAMKELIARIQVLAKRKSGEVKLITFKNLNVDLSERTASIDKLVLKLSPTNFKILETLVRKAPKGVSRQEIMTTVWGDDQPDSNSLKVHIYHLRKQLEAATNEIKLATLPNFGFVLREGDAK